MNMNWFTKDLGPSPKIAFGILLIGLIGFVVYGSYGGHITDNKVILTRAAIAATVTATDEYKKQTGHYPVNLNDLLIKIGSNAPVIVSPQIMKDGWGHSLSLVITGGYFRVVSAGRDGQLGTKDDILGP